MGSISYVKGRINHLEGHHTMGSINYLKGSINWVKPIAAASFRFCADPPLLLSLPPVWG